MKEYLLPTLLATVSLMGCANAETVQWLEQGDVMHADTTETAAKTEGNTMTNDIAMRTTENSASENTVTLATGQEVILTGGVYVKTDDTSKVLAWAATHDYIALEDPYIGGAMHVQTTPEDSIQVANLIGALDGVTTAAPKYRTPVVAK